MPCPGDRSGHHHAVREHGSDERASGRDQHPGQRQEEYRQQERHQRRRQHASQDAGGDADQKDTATLAAELREVSALARAKGLPMDKMQGGCFSITSLGGIGGTYFTPIINAPEVAILGVTGIKTKPVWNGHEFVPRQLMPLSLSYDHRVINGADAARFVHKIAAALTQWDAV